MSRFFSSAVLGLCPFLEQRHAQHGVVGAIHVLEHLVHAERKRHEQPPSPPAARSAYQSSASRFEFVPRGENTACRALPRFRRRRRGVRVGRPVVRVHRRILSQSVPVIEEGLGNSLVFDDMAQVRVPENAVLGEVGRAGPDCRRLPVPAEDEEFVVHDLGPLVRPRHTDLILDMAIASRFFSHGPSGFRVLRIFRRNRRSLALRRRDPSPPSPLPARPSTGTRTRPRGSPTLARPADERDQRFEQAAGQPVVCALPRLIRRLVLEPPSILLSRHRTAIEERRVHGAIFRLGRDRQSQLDPFQIAGSPYSATIV